MHHKLSRWILLLSHLQPAFLGLSQDQQPKTDLALYFAELKDADLPQQSLEREAGFEIPKDCQTCGKYSGLNRPTWCPATYIYHCEDMMPHGSLASPKYKSCRSCCIQAHETDKNWEGMWTSWCSKDGGPDVPKLPRRRTIEGYRPQDVPRVQEPLYTNTAESGQSTKFNSLYGFDDPDQQEQLMGVLNRDKFGVDLNEEYDQAVVKIRNSVEEREGFFLHRQTDKNQNEEEENVIKNAAELAESVKKALKKGPKDEEDMFMDDLMKGYFLKSLEREDEG